MDSSDYRSQILELQLDSFEKICKNALIYLHNEREIVEAGRGHHFCPDEMIGFVENVNGKWKFTRREDYSETFVFAIDYESYCKNDDSIGNPLIFILESPHKAEFLKKGNGKNVYLHGKKIFARPANGCTKRLFNKFVDEVLDNLSLPLDSKKHPVIIINACCYRCSLGKNTKLYRDRVFKRLFESTISKFNKAALLKRIKYLKPWILVNACTKGNNKDYELRKKVDEFLDENHINFYKCCHPSSWRSPENQKKRS